ncbi:Beta-galactosidase 5, partial [Globisporangium splendens]
MGRTTFSADNERDDLRKLLVDVGDEFADDTTDSPMHIKEKKKTRWMRRADAVCLAIVGFAACYVMIWQPPVRRENPFLITQRQQHQEEIPDQGAAQGSKEYGNSNVKYMTYADIDQEKRKHGYTVDYSQRGFVIDGHHTLLIGGSIHYPRSTPSMWRDLLLKAKDDGLNHIQMYVFWNLHEQERDVYDFSGGKNITKFYELAAEMGIFLHVRFGPYVCAEWDNGGLPVWLNWIPNMKVRSNNGPWKSEMERFVRKMVDIARPFMASKGGPIILAQIENEFTMEDPEYIEWCGKLVKDLGTSIPWVMCNGKSAPNTILACNANDCIDFARNQTRDRPAQPLIWTENEGWYQKWAEEKPSNATTPPPDQRSASEVAYAVARWFAVGGAAQNYYMYHGGNNYGRSASAGVTTMYADGVNLHADGLSNEPKRSHLRKLHKALISINNIVMRYERQLPYPKPISESSTVHRGASTEDPLQRAYVYGNKKAGQAVFLENAADKGARVTYDGAKYYLAARSVVILENEEQGSSNETTKLLYNSSDVATSFPHRQHRVYSPLVAESALTWKSWSELVGAQGVPRKSILKRVPMEQLRVTRDKTDYLTYETTFRLDKPPVAGKPTTLRFTSCEANAFIVFLNHRFVGDQYLGYPGENCSMEFEMNLPVQVIGNEKSFRKHHHLTLMSVSLGIHSLGHDHKKGLTGAVRINNDLDLVGGHGEWKMLPGLVGEQLELFDPQWTDSVEWKPVQQEESTVEGEDPNRFPVMAWYKTTFLLPEPDEPSPTAPVEEVSSILLDCNGLTRGRAYVNGHDLGRYWMIRDANDQFVQQYYHIPTEWLYTDNATPNLLVVFDELGGTVSSVRIVLSTMVETKEVDHAPLSISATSTSTETPIQAID